MSAHSAGPASGRSFGREAWLWLILFCAAGAALRLVAAVTFTAIERADEIFQNLEPAYRLWTGHGVVTWEWRDGIRSWVFPGALSLLMALTSLLHLPDGAALPLIWGVLSVVSCGVIAAGVSLGWRQFGTTGALLCGILTAFWPDLVYFGPKTLGEVQAGNLLVVAAALASFGPVRRAQWHSILIGVLLGAAFALRFQLSLSLLLVACWTARLEVRRSWVPLLLGAALPLGLLGGIDWWTLGSPFQSVWKNIQVNFFQDKAAFYGTEPIYIYLIEFAGRNGAAVVAMAALFAYGARCAPLMALTAASVVAFHSLVAHKELSFIYAALPCAVLTSGLGASRFVENLQHWLQRPPSRRTARIAAAAVAAVTIDTVAIAERPFTMPADQAAMVTLTGYAHAQADLCGLGLYANPKFEWSRTGGYSFLRRPVPIYLANSPAAFAESRAGFNYAIARHWMVPMMPGFAVVHCAGEFCLFHQPVQCQPDAPHEISAELARLNE